MRLFKIMFGIAIGIFILSIVKIKGNTILSLVTGKFTGLFSEDSRSYMQRYGALIIALELILQKNSIFGFLFGNGLSSLVGNFVTNRRNNVCISSRIHIGCINKVTIASGVLIAGNVLIEDHYHGDVSSSEADIEPNKRILKSRGEISIGENVWIGENVVIMPGVSIGRGCVIGANSTVTKSIPDYAVAAGSPAKIIRRLKN